MSEQKDVTYIRTLKAAGELLDVSQERIKQLIADGTLQAINISSSKTNKKWLISLVSIEAYKASRQSTGWYFYKQKSHNVQNTKLP